MYNENDAVAPVEGRTEPTHEELGRLFLKPGDVSLLIAASPGDIFIECKLESQPSSKVA